MSLTLTLALRYLRRRRPLAALALSSFAAAATSIATGLTSGLNDPPTLFLLYVLTGLAILAALLGLVYVLGNGVSQRAVDLAALREAGATPAQLRRLLLTEALILAGLGTIAGTLIGLAVVSLAGRLSGPSLFAGLILALASGLLLGGVAGLAAARRALPRPGP